MERLSQDSLDEDPRDGGMDTDEPAEVLSTVYPKEAVSSTRSPDIHLPEQMRVSGDTEMSDGNGLTIPEGKPPAGASQQEEHSEEEYHQAMEEEGSGLETRHGGPDHEDIEGEAKEGEIVLKP